MQIKQAKMDDLNQIMEILRDGRNQLAEQGIDQWQGDYPNEEHIKEDIEKSLNSYLGKGWTFERMDGTLQALLLCAIYEITTNSDIDAKVIIKEYVDLAYAFFTKQEPKMVNALLDQIAHDVRDDLNKETGTQDGDVSSL